MKHHVVVATHHKSGTNWMGGVFQMIATELDVPYVHLSRIRSVAERQAVVDNAPDPEQDPHIFFHAYGRFPRLKAGRKKFRGIHVVRDPRDMILSAAKYHTWSEESWLHEPLEEFDGMTYQEKINSFSAEEDQIRFEMENNSAKVIGMMRDFDLYDCMFDVRYEDMRRDADLLAWHHICLKLGFAPHELPVCFNAFMKHSIQFGQVNAKSHIQDTSVSRWQKRFPSDLLVKAETDFGEALDRFGFKLSSA
jgi:hypothetical protein